MKWEPAERDVLAPVIQRLRDGLDLSDEGRVLALCSAHSALAMALAHWTPGLQVLGLELDDRLRREAQASAIACGLSDRVAFEKATYNCIPYPDGTFDALVSEFIVDGTPKPTEIGQAEMARVIKPGGTVVLTDVIATEPVSATVRSDLAEVGLDYLCEATSTDFRRWMTAAGLDELEVADLTPVAVAAWHLCRRRDPHAPGYVQLLDGPRPLLGQTILYIYARGKKPIA